MIVHTTRTDRDEYRIVRGDDGNYYVIRQALNPRTGRPWQRTWDLAAPGGRKGNTLSMARLVMKAEMVRRSRDA